LLAALTRFQPELARHMVAERPLHGSPHSANTIVVSAGIRFTDLETACVGPLESNGTSRMSAIMSLALTRPASIAPCWGCAGCW
jgi:hypothetical protein